MKMRFLGVVTAIGAGAILADVRDARACGGCFHAQTDTSTSFVSDHRMVVSISPKQTVLWDQVQFTGDPSEFAWVLPVREGTRVELAHDEWIQALDVATRPSVKGPDVACGNGASGGGVGCGSMSSSLSSSDRGAAEESSGDGGYRSGAGVQVVSQEVVGPYDAVTVRSSKGEAIHLWLRLNGFAVPDSIEPILGQYTGEGFDFLALRLRPNTGVRSMRPVRVVMPGAIPTLPLRMVAAGIGAKVGITLFVVTEGRYHPKNFPDATFDPSALAWDAATAKSNYRELVDRALLATQGRGWITEYAGQPFSTKIEYSAGGAGISGTSLAVPLDAFYRTACVGRPDQLVSCDGGIALPPDAGVRDASGDIDADASDAESDAAPEASALPDPGPGPTPTPVQCTKYITACEDFDDDQVALTGLHRSDVWVTRLRAELSANDCASGDLELEPSPDASARPARLKTDKFTDPNFDPCGDDDSSGCACHTTTRRVDVTPAVLAAVGVAAIVRNRRRRRR